MGIDCGNMAEMGKQVDIVDVNIVAVSGNRIGLYDKALPVKVVPE